MSVYWATFRLERNTSYETRYKALTEAISKISSKWWVEPTSFLLFESNHDIDQVAAVVQRCIDLARDVVLIGMTEFKPARLLGTVKYHEVFELMPSIKKV